MSDGSVATNFGGMTADKQREIARLGGKSVPADKRTFSQDTSLAARAGSVGGKRSAEARKRRKLEREAQNKESMN